MTRARNGAASAAPERAPAARLDPYSVAINLARQAADRRRPRADPLTRREALNEAPWFAALTESGCGEREWRVAYADRLIERGLAEPSSHGRRSGPSGPSGRGTGKKLGVLFDDMRLERYRAAAATAGMTLADWARQALDAAS